MEESFLDLALACKEAGNAEMRRGVLFRGHTAGKNALLEACTEYAKGLGHMMSLERALEEEGGPLQEEEGDRRKKIDVGRALYSNLAQANLLLEEWAPAESCCCKLLVEDEEIAAAAAATLVGDLKSRAITDGGDAAVTAACKALYRRGQAREGLGQLKEAEHDMKRALRLRPSDKDIRAGIRSLREKIASQEKKEEVRRQTEEGRQRRKLRESLSPAEKMEVEIPSPAQSESPEDQGPAVPKEHVSARTSSDSFSYDDFETINGGVVGDQLFKWSQTVYDVKLCMAVPIGMGPKDINVELHRMRICVTCSGRELFSGKLSRPIRVDDSLWMLEGPGFVSMELRKELPSEGSPGFEWWDRVMDGDPPVDTSEMSAGDHLSDFPEHALRKAEESIWREKNKTDEEKERDVMMKQMIQEEEEKLAKQEEALKDPKKAAIYSMLKEKFPNVPVSIS
jgi:tetratricopeptide (TPR) repeat protein